MHLEKALKTALKLQKKLSSLPVEIDHAAKRYKSFLGTEYTEAVDVDTAEESYKLKSQYDELLHCAPVVAEQLREQKEIIKPYLQASEKPIKYPFVVDGLISEQQYLFRLADNGEVLISEV